MQQIHKHPEPQTVGDQRPADFLHFLFGGVHAGRLAAIEHQAALRLEFGHPPGILFGAEGLARHQTLPRGYRTTVGTVGPLEQVLFGPSHQADGKTNFIGALKRAMASTGYVDVKNFQRCGMVVNPYSAR